MERDRAKERELAAQSSKAAPLWPEYFHDPVGFVASVLFVRIWRKQRRILEAIARKKKVVVRSGQKTGKSTVFVLAALWWAATRARARVLFTAPGNKAVRNILWKELRRIVYSKRPDGQRICDVLGVEPALQPHTGMQWPDGREILGYSADVPENMQGFSGPETLTLIDESSGVEDAIFEAIDGNAAGGGHIAAAGNPTRQEGWYFDAFHLKREFWEGIEISSEETPNVTGEEEPIEGLAGPDFIAKRRAEYGEDSAFYMIRILGRFAGTASNAIVGLWLIEKAQHRYDERADDNLPTDPLEFGVDVARFGDDESAITPRRGVRAWPTVAVQGFDTLAVVGKLIEVHTELARPGEKVVVKIDTSGGYGGGVADVLRASHSSKFEVVEVNSSERSDDAEKNYNLRTQLHFAVAEWLKDGGEISKDRKLEAELLTPTYGFDDRGRRKVESKDQIKKRLKRSPDRADSLMLAVYKRANAVNFVGGGRGASRVGASRGF